MSEDYEFIEQVDGQPYLEVADSDEYVALDAVFDRYTEDFDIVETARFFSMTHEDVRNGITYWRENPEALGNTESDTSQSKYLEKNDDQDLTQDEPKTVEPLGAATNVFLRLMTDYSLDNSRINNSPRENYFGEISIDEVHFEWEQDGHEVSVYAGVDRQEDEGFVSFSVDGDEGETVVVNGGDQGLVTGSEGDFKDRLTQMYNNAVLETRNLG